MTYPSAIMLEGATDTGSNGWLIVTQKLQIAEGKYVRTIGHLVLRLLSYKMQKRQSFRAGGKRGHKRDAGKSVLSCTVMRVSYMITINATGRPR